MLFSYEGLSLSCSVAFLALTQPVVIVSWTSTEKLMLLSVIEKAMYAGGGGNILPLWEKWQHPHAERELLPTRPQSLLELAEQLQNKCLELEGKQ